MLKDVTSRLVGRCNVVKSSNWKHLKYKAVKTTFECLHFYTLTVEPPVASTSPQRPVFQNTKSFQVKSLYLEPLVKRPPLVSDRDHLLNQKF